MSAPMPAGAAAAASAPTSASAKPVAPIRVGLAGCTGVVGQRFISLLMGDSSADPVIPPHPYFQLVALSASERSAGQRYDAACQWRISSEMPAAVRSMPVGSTSVGTFQLAQCRLVFSALDASVAGPLESELARAGMAVFSNARNHRTSPRVPILVPHANAEHLAIIPHQQRAANYPPGGFIITNANCSSTGLVVALRPLRDAFGIDKLFVTTMQAVSGAGYPGVSSLDIVDNVIPHIGGEEDKMEEEPQKILGSIGVLSGDSGGSGKEGGDPSVDAADVPQFLPAPFVVSAQCNRVAVLDGHMECVSVQLSRPASVEQVESCMRTWQSEAQSLKLPSAPRHPLFVHTSDVRPQPRLDRDRERGFVVTVGRVRPCPLLHFKFVLCSHNTVLGAAGGSILNAELAVAKGYL